jgi:uncharacterized SAM-binding protein YcdF (DUF218 family)
LRAFCAFKRAFILILAVVGALFLVVTFTPLVKVTAEAIEPDWYDGNGEVLVVLGGSMLVSGTGPQATLAYDTYLRCVYASWILRTHKFHYVIVSGGDGLAPAMAGFLSRNGVDPRFILAERSATSTYENAVFTRNILEQQYGASKIPEVVILTSDYHAWRARRTFEHCGIRSKVIPVPDLIKRSSTMTYRLTGAITLLSEWGKDFFYIASRRA